MDFRQKLEDSALLLRVVLLVLFVQRLWEEAPKLSAKFLIVLPASSEKGFQRCRCTFQLSPRELDSSVPSDLLRGLQYRFRVVCSSDRSSGGVIFVGSSFFLSYL